MDYSVVRNHWLNKFSNDQPNQNSNKRKSSETIPLPAKLPKLSQTSLDSLDCDSASCPVCDVSYPIEELNSHLDICLSTPRDNYKECIVCMKKIDESEYQRHVNECLEKNFGDNTPDNNQNDSVILIEDDSMDVNDTKCSICNNQIAIEDMEEHLKLCRNRTKCPECGKKLNSDCYDIHVADCLMKTLDKIDKILNHKENNEKPEETINCLVCGKLILKINLYSHLDDCMKEVFDKEEDQTDVADDKDDKLYNCPFCLKLMSEVDMSDHIDVCLKTADCDLEAQENKSLFLSEID